MLGTIEVAGRELVAEVMAASRVGRLRVALEAADAAAFAFTSADKIDLAQYERRSPKAAPTEDDDENLRSPEVLQMMADLEDRHYRGWLDESIPALSGRTPREAAKSKAMRARLIALIKDMQASSERARLAGRPAYDFSWMWKELDLLP